MKYFLAILLFTTLSVFAQAQTYTISGRITNAENNEDIIGASVCLDQDNCVLTDVNGKYKMQQVKPGKYTLFVVYMGGKQATHEVVVSNKNVTANMPIAVHTTMLDSINVTSYRSGFGTTHLKDVDGSGIYAGKKSEVVVMKDLVANKATNNARQIYYDVAGLNIWENDGGAGIQLAIGGRGLDPNRVSNFNTRQNGYDISADALGYPESYYTPPAEVIDRIEVVRGAASLQYGTQFGGIINFKMNDGPDSQKCQVIARETAGSWGFLNTSTSIGGTIKKWKYYAFYEHKQGNGWRPNSQFNLNMGYLSATYHANRKLSITAQYTHMDYLEHQPGGLTDLQFYANPQQSTKSRNWFKVNWNLSALLLDYQINKNLTFNTRFFDLIADRSTLGAIVYQYDPGGPRGYRTDNYWNWGDESRLIYTYHQKSNPFTLLGGFRYYNGYTNRQVGNGNDGSGGSKSDFSFSKATEFDSLSYSRYRFPNHNTSLFLENIFRVNSKLSIIPGLRYERIATVADGSYNIFQMDQVGNILSNQVVTDNKISKRSFLIGGIGVSYDQSTDCQFYANISQNYRSIDFNDMGYVNSSTIVDPNLKDEKGYSADLGVRGHYKNIVNYDVSLFLINYADKIGKIPFPPDNLLITNISKSHNYGIESFAEVDLWRLIKGEGAKTRLILYTNFSIINARYVSTQQSAYNNKEVEFVPPVIFKTGLTLKKGKFSATYQYSYTAKQFSDATNAVQPGADGIYGLVPSYYVMDLTATYNINKIFSVSGSINNLTNNMYFTRRADSYPGPGIIPADARGYYLTLQVKI